MAAIKKGAKKAQMGGLMSMFGGKDNPIYKKTTDLRGKLGSAMGLPGKPIIKKGGKIKKAQNGLRSKSDATRVDKPAINNRPATKYKYLDLFVGDGKKPNATDSAEYRGGYKSGISGKGVGLFSGAQRIMGGEEGKENYKKNSIKKEKTGGKVTKAKDGKWIQKAINPKHKGFCTPETKATCTPRRKALAHTLRKMAKKK